MKYTIIFSILFIFILLPQGQTQKTGMSTQNPPVNFSYGVRDYNGEPFGPGTGYGHQIGNPSSYDDLCKIVRIPSSGLDFGQAVYVDVILKVKLEQNGFTIPNGPDCTNPQNDYSQSGAAIVLTVDVSIRKLSNDQLITRYVRYEINNVSEYLDIFAMRSYNIGDENNPPPWSDYLEQHIRMLPTNLDPGCCGDAVILDQKTQTYLRGSQLVTLDNIQVRGDSGGTDLSPDNNCGGDHRIDYINFNDYLEIWVSDDNDGDGIPDQGIPPEGVEFDNCRTISNPSQTNSDNDDFGNVCDNCPFTANNNQSDTDGDLLGDACDNCPSNTNAAQTNSDFDSHGDACDNCPFKNNQDQSDLDNDGIGDACDFEDCPIEAIYQVQSYTQFIFGTLYNYFSRYLIYYDQTVVSLGDQLSYSSLSTSGTITINDYPQEIFLGTNFGLGSPFAVDLQFSSVPQCTYPLVGLGLSVDDNLSVTCSLNEETYCQDSDNYVIDFSSVNIFNSCVGTFNAIEVFDRATGISIPNSFDDLKLFLNTNFELGMQTITVVFRNGCGARSFCDVIIDVQDCETCPLFYEITDPVSQSASLQASDYISISSSIDETLVVEYSAGNYVLLEPGFSINTNSEFLGEIGSCESVTVCNVECNCDDGIDNDGDGQLDCLDADCAFNYNCICTPTLNTITCPNGLSFPIQNNSGLLYVELSIYDIVYLPCNANYSASFTPDGLSQSMIFDCNDLGDIQISSHVFQGGELVDICFSIIEIIDSNGLCN